MSDIVPSHRVTSGLQIVGAQGSACGANGREEQKVQERSHWVTRSSRDHGERADAQALTDLRRTDQFR